MRNRKGQIGAMLTMFLPVLLGSVALSVDAGMFYYNWALLQKAADAAALAGAGFLPDTVKARTQATSFAELNGIKASEIVSVTPAANGLSIAVKLQRTVPFYFARVLGLVSGPVSVTAVAGPQPNPNGARGLMPVSLNCPGGDCSKYKAGNLYQIKATSLAPGNWGVLALGGSGSSIYRTNIENGYIGPPSVNVGDLVTTETGNVAGPTVQGFSDRINVGLAIDPSGTWHTAPSYDPRVVIVPMADFNNINGNSQVPIVGFALMWVDSLSGSTINAYYLGPAIYNSSQQTLDNAGTLPPILLQ